MLSLIPAIHPIVPKMRNRTTQIMASEKNHRRQGTVDVLPMEKTVSPPINKRFPRLAILLTVIRRFELEERIQFFPFRRSI